MDVGFLIQQYLNNIREYFAQKLSEMEAFQDRQAAEIEALTNKLLIMGVIAIVLVVVIIILLIVLKSGNKRRKRREMEEREDRLRREEQRLREDRMRFEEEMIKRQQRVEPGQMQIDHCQAAPEGSSSRKEYGTPSKRSYPGRQNDKEAREWANRETRYLK